MSRIRTAAVTLVAGLAVIAGGLVVANPAGSTPTTFPAIDLTTPAAGAINGVVLDTQPVVTFYDANGAVDTAATCPVTAAVSPSSGITLTGGVVTPTNGVATFTALTISGATSGTPLTLTYTTGDATSDPTNCSTITTALTVTQTATITPTDAAADVEIVTHASTTAVSGRALATQPVVKIVDNAGTTVTAGNPHTVTVSIGNGATSGSATATLGCVGGGSACLTKTTVNGIATFADLVITNVGSAVTPDDYTLTYAATGLTPAAEPTPTTLTLAVATQAVLTTSASGVTSGSAFTTQPVITLQDGGLTTPDPACTVTASVTSGSLVGTTSATTVHGVATFTNLGITGNPSTTHTITYTAAKTSSTPNCTLGSTTLTISQTVTLPGPTATRLVVSRSAQNAMNGHGVYIQPQITQTDANGITVTASSVTVTASISSGATLSGTTTATTSSGIATFTGLIVNGTPGTTYTLTFSSSGLTSATQQITVSVASQLGVKRVASGITSGVPFTVQPQIARQNASGTTIVENPPTVVTASVSGGATLVGTTTATTASGLATFTGLGITGTNGTSYTMTFTAPGMAATTMTVTVGTPAATTATTTTTTTTSAPMSNTMTVEKTPAQRVRPLGGGVSVVTNPTGVSKVVSTPLARRLDQAKPRTVKRNALVSLVFADQARGEKVKIAMRIDGKWVGIKQIKVGKDGKVTVPTMRFAKAGSYPIRVRTSGGEPTQYARIVAR